MTAYPGPPYGTPNHDPSSLVCGRGSPIMDACWNNCTIIHTIHTSHCSFGSPAIITHRFECPSLSLGCLLLTEWLTKNYQDFSLSRQPSFSLSLFLSLHLNFYVSLFLSSSLCVFHLHAPNHNKDCNGLPRRTGPPNIPLARSESLKTSTIPDDV
jgi:hypothetical protein